MLAQSGQTRRHIWIVDHDTDIAAQLIDLCAAQRLDCSSISGAEATIASVSAAQPDLVMIACTNISSSILNLCNALRASEVDCRPSVIIVSSDGQESNMIAALEAGADDYVTTPYSVRELSARIQAVLRRSGPPGSDWILRFADIELDKAAVRVSRGDIAIHLGPTEYRLLRHFMEHPNWVLSRDILCRAIRDDEQQVDLRCVDVHVLRLRKALNGGGLINHIHTIRSLGYYLGEPA